MKKSIIIRFIFLISLIVISLYYNLRAEEYLTLKKAIGIALKNNYSIRIAENKKEITENNVSIGNAGFLPTIDFNLKYTEFDSKTNQQNNIQPFSSTTDKKYGSLYSEIELNWTVFDGFSMFYDYEQFKEINQAEELKLRLSVENTIYQVINLYYDIIRQKELIRNTKLNINYSSERLRIIEEKYRIGSAAKLELLQNKVYLNDDKSELLNNELELSDLKVSMNTLLERDKKLLFDIVDSITINNNYDINNLINKAFENNANLLAVQKQLSIAQRDISISKSFLYPQISLFANYNYTNNDFRFGDIKSNNTGIFNYGLNLNMNLFNSFNHSRNIQNATINADILNYQYLEIKSQTETEIIIAYDNYNLNKEIVTFEEENLNYAKEYLEIAFEQLKLGKYTALELRQAQMSYSQAQDRLVKAKYNTKISEINLLKLTGYLLEN